MHRRRFLAGAASLAPAGCLGRGPGGRSTPTVAAGDAPWPVTVTRVVDGDTVDVRFADGRTDRVRLLGVDAPETRADTDSAEFEGVPDTPAGREWLRRWGEAATDFAVRRLDGGTVDLAVDPTADRRGGYDRLLAYLFVGESSFNRALLERGLARLYDTAFERRDAFAAAERRARDADRGVWGFETAGDGG